MNTFHLSLAFLMLVTGSLNTLSVKWADTMSSISRDGKLRGFQHPFVQASGMFLGEMMCLAAYYLLKCYYKRRREQSVEWSNGEEPSSYPEVSNSRNSNTGVEQEEDPKFNPLIFFPPAICDMTATSIQYIGLTLTYASSFQMLRGAVIIFTGLLSRFVLKRMMSGYKWFAILFIITGLTLVGVSDMLYEQGGSDDNTNGTAVSTGHNYNYGSTILGVKYHSTINSSSEPLDEFIEEGIHLLLGENNTYSRVMKNDSSGSGNKTSNTILIGDSLIVLAQIIVATQMVYEEKFILKYNVPALLAVGYEGLFGFSTLSCLLIPMYFIPNPIPVDANPRHVIEDLYDALHQLANNGWLATAFCSTIFSIAFFNFAGISVTREMSATTRMVLDSIRTVVIWGVSLLIGWQDFHLIQLLGFSVLMAGMCIYNDLLFGPLIRRCCGMTSSTDQSDSLIDNDELVGASRVIDSHRDNVSRTSSSEEESMEVNDNTIRPSNRKTPPISTSVVRSEINRCLKEKKSGRDKFCREPQRSIFENVD